MTGRLLTDYHVAAALEMARMVDPAGNDPTSLTTAAIHATTQGRWPADQLEAATATLLNAQLLRHDGTRIRAIPTLTLVTAMPDDQALVVLRQLLTHTDKDPPDDARRTEIGAAAEIHVAQQCVHQLTTLGYPYLADRVQRVSLISDALGYDVTAPTTNGLGQRMLEVKGSTLPDADVFRFFLSRNEYTVGTRSPMWHLVACTVTGTSEEQVDIIGHCSGATLDPYLPDDRNGRWTEAAVTIPRFVLSRGLPPAATA